MAMRPDNRRIDQPAIYLLERGIIGKQFEELGKTAAGYPTTQPVVRRIPGTEFTRQIPPGNASPGQVQYSLKEHPLGDLRWRPAGVLLCLLDDRFQGRPTFIRKHVPHGILASAIDRSSIHDHKCLP